MYRTHTCGELTIANVGQEVTLAGWLQRSRDLGGMTFIDLRDRYGITQLAFNMETNADLCEQARKLGREYVIQASGTVIERSSKNSKIPTGDIEIEVHHIRILNEAQTPPFTIEDNSDGGDDLRMRYRYLDIRRNPVRRNLELRHKMAMQVRNYLSNQNFLEVETPMLIKSTPEGARDFVVPSRMNPGEFYALPQSPQQYKQLLMVAGIDRYFQIVRCFRDEDLRADRQPEFTQIDCEMSFVEQEDVLNTFEGLILHLFQELKGLGIGQFHYNSQFCQTHGQMLPRITWHDAMRLYGSDKPDVRFDMQFVELNDVVKNHGFALFDTKYSNFKITSKDCPYAARKNADMVRDIWDAFRRRGLAISCYFSKADWHHEDYWEDHGIGHYTTWYPTYLPKEHPEKWTRFERFMRNQMVELCRDYGRIEIMWLDGAAVGCRPDTRVDMSSILAECRKYQPWLIAADRSIEGPNQQLITPEQTVPDQPMACPWESCITMASNWSYRFDDEYKSARELVQLLVGIVAKGGCLALNVAPRPDGVIPEPALERLNAMGAWLRANGRSIYSTRPFPPYSVRNWCFTQRAGRYYAIRLTREGEHGIQQVVLNNDKSKGWKIDRIFHVSTDVEIPCAETENGWVLRLPTGFVADPYADAFELVFSR